jgi:hypothetical protein
MNSRAYFPNRFFSALTVILVLIALSATRSALSASADTVSEPETESTKQVKSLGGFNLAESGVADPEKATIFPTVWCADISNVDTQLSCWKAYRNGLDYYRFGLKHREDVLKWQHLSTKIILIVVLILVAMGLYFAWVQFRDGTTEQTSTEIEVSTSSLKVSSPVLGVIILIVSLAFFYLYLIYVYPIQEVI